MSLLLTTLLLLGARLNQAGITPDDELLSWLGDLLTRRLMETGERATRHFVVELCTVTECTRVYANWVPKGDYSDDACAYWQHLTRLLRQR